MKVRRARREDASVITTQNILLAQESEDVVLSPETVQCGVSALLSDPKKGFYVVAEETGTIIGQMMITFEWSDWRNSQLWWVQSVYVQKSWRKKGVFSLLLDFVQKSAANEGVVLLRLYVFEDNIQARTIYETMGWIKEHYVFYQCFIEPKPEK